MKTRKDEGNLSSGDGKKTSSQPSTGATENLVRMDDGGRSKRFDGDRREGKSENWRALAADVVSGGQEASQPKGWDIIEGGPPTMEKGEHVCAAQKVLQFELAKGKEKVGIDANSTVSSQLVGLSEEHKVTSSLKSKQSTKAESEISYLDMGQCKEKKPKAKGEIKEVSKGRRPNRR